MAAQILFGHYPMSIPELNAWGQQQAGKLSPDECNRALHRLDHSRIVIRRVK
jgi:hypothetical protein